METEEQAQERNKNAWLITFSDLVSLMLTFFVLLFSMSSVKVDEWENVIDSLSRTLNPERILQQTIPTTTQNIPTAFRKRAINLDYLSSVLRETVVKEGFIEDAKLSRLDDRLILTLPGDLLFEPASAVLTEGAEKTLFSLGGVLQNIGNQVGVSGHSDPTPITGGAFTSNWELSTARASAVVNALRVAGYKADVIAFGFADSRYNQLPNLPTPERQALSRRVDIVIFPTAGGI